MSTYRRVAFFLDYENLYASLKRLNTHPDHPYGRPPALNFEHLVEYIETHYGSLRKPDFIAVANRSHYNLQKGGLNRLATVIGVQSFLPREERRRRQRTPGKRYVYKNYADMRLALEIGRHLATRSADLYLIGSGDGSFAAVGHALLQAHKPVLFLVPDPLVADQALLTEFEWIAYTEIAAEFPPAVEEAPAPVTPATPPPPDEVDTFCDTLRTLRRTLSTGIPVDLMIAIYGVEQGTALVRKAQGRGLIDLWENPQGLPCLSLQSERLSGVVQRLPTRADVADKAHLLRQIAEIAAQPSPPSDPAAWRRALHHRLGLSNQQAKRLFRQLVTLGVLDYGHMQRPHLNLDTVLRFLQTP